LTKWLQTFLTPTTNSFALQSKSKHTCAKIEHKVHTSTPLYCGFCATRSKKKQRCRCNEQGKKQRQVATFTFLQHKKVHAFSFLFTTSGPTISNNNKTLSVFQRKMLILDTKSPNSNTPSPYFSSTTLLILQQDKKL